jgi:ribokinase
MDILVAGLINIETTLRVDEFPVPYRPVNYPFFGVNSSVSGVGYNLAKALTVLGDRVHFLSLVGKDDAGRLARLALERDGLPGGDVLELLPATCQSVILYDSQGKREVFADLKDIQERSYPLERFEQAAQSCRWLALCNINFTRPLLERARKTGKFIATDVHLISDLDDPYNKDYMAAAHILFMSDERLPVPPEDWARRLWDRFGTEIAVIGLGAQGALLAVRSGRILERLPAAQVRPVVNTIGAGDALFSAFLHSYIPSGDPYLSLQKAILFASYKIGVASAAQGFLDHAGLEELYAAGGLRNR